MKIPFDIKYRPQIESGEYTVETRDGVHATILEWDIFIHGMAHMMLIRYNDKYEFVHSSGRINRTGQDCNLDLFIVTPEEELSEFEKGLVKFYRTRGEIQPDKDGVFNRHEVNELLHKAASELLAIARTELVKQGYIIEKKAFHDAVEKVDPEVMKEVSENINLENFIHNLSERYPEVSFAKLTRIAKVAYDYGKAEALKDLPRWRYAKDQTELDKIKDIALVRYYNNYVSIINERPTLPLTFYLTHSDLAKLPTEKRG